jgi:hypothetical protein
MITQNELDKIVQRLQNNEEVYLYYAAHCVELREGILDETIYKSVNRFRPIKVKITGVQNAYFELLRFLEHPQDFHTETEEEYYDVNTKYIHYYTVPNTLGPYPKTFTAMMPSIVYGYRRKLYYKDGTSKEFNDPSPVVPIYTNNPEYGDYTSTTLSSALDNGSLDWKYMKVEDPIEDDGILYYYITSDYYILDIENFPRTEKPLINTKQKCAYFLNLCDCLSYIKQLEA